MPSSTDNQDSDSTELRGKRWRVTVPTVIAYGVLVLVAGGVVDTVRRLDRIEAKIDSNERIAEVRRADVERRLAALEKP
jgi:hypothetical protein